MSDNEVIEGWEPTKKSLRPPSDSASVRINKQDKPKKATFKRVTESDATSWWETAFDVVGDFSGYPEVWKIDKEESKKLGKPSATIYNDMPEKFRKLLGIDNLEQGAFIFACLQLGWYLKKSVGSRLTSMAMMKAEQLGEMENMTDAEIGQSFRNMFGNGG